MESKIGYNIMLASMFINAVVGSLATVILLILTTVVIKKNRSVAVVQGDYFNRMLLLMSIFQLMYDVSIPAYFFPDLPLGLRLMGTIGSVNSFIISSLIGFSVFYILYYKTIFDMKKWRWHFVAAILIVDITFLATILYYYYDNGRDRLFGNALLVPYILRVVLICLQFGIYGASKYLVDSMLGLKNPDQSKKIVLSNSMIAMKVLVERLKYYPLLQACGRVPITLYVFMYGFYSNSTDPSRFAFYLSTMTYLFDLAPVGFLYVYVKMQPTAYTLLENAFKDFLNSINVRSICSNYNKCSTKTSTSDPDHDFDVTNPIPKTASDENVISAKGVVETASGGDVAGDMDSNALVSFRYSVNMLRESSISSDTSRLSGNDLSNFIDNEVWSIRGRNVENPPVRKVHSLGKPKANSLGSTKTIGVNKNTNSLGKTSANFSVSQSTQALREAAIAYLDDDELLSLMVNEGSVNAKINDTIEM